MNDLEDVSYSILADEIDVDENNDSDDFDSEDSDVSLKVDMDMERGADDPNAYKIEISQDLSDYLYGCAGTTMNESENEVSVMPSMRVISTSDEQLILEAKTSLGIKFEIDKFQVQALLSLFNGENVVVISPCGSGKMLIFYMGVYIMRKKYNLPNGIGICLEPLNNILSEKTNNHPPLKTAFLTMAGEGIKAGNVSLSHDFSELLSGDIPCLLGHAESFLSPKGIPI